MPDSRTPPEPHDGWAPSRDGPLLSVSGALLLGFGSLALLFLLAT